RQREGSNCESLKIALRDPLTSLGMTGAFSGINRHDAAGKRLGCGILKSAGVNQIAHRTTAGKSFDRSAEILVGFFFTRNDCGSKRQNSAQVKSVKEVKNRPWRQRKIEHEQMARRSQDTTHFAQCSSPIAHVPETECDGYGIERLFC